MRAARAEIHIAIFAMIRPRGRDFFYSAEEFAGMARDVAQARNYGMDGAVFGLLGADRRVDVERTRALVKLAEPLPVTFHRAFDDTPDLRAALEDVVASGAAKILTSGGMPSAEQGVSTISKLVAAAGKRIGILVGGGINAANLERVLQGTRGREFHSGLSSTLPYPRTDCAAFETEVRKLAEVLKKYPLETGNMRERA